MQYRISVYTVFYTFIEYIYDGCLTYNVVGIVQP